MEEEEEGWGLHRETYTHLNVLINYSRSSSKVPIMHRDGGEKGSGTDCVMCVCVCDSFIRLFLHSVVGGCSWIVEK